MGLVVAFLAAAAGVAQAALLRRAAARRGPHPLQFAVRLLLVALVLSAAAQSGWLAAAVAGWAIGFAGSVLVLAGRAR